MDVVIENKTINQALLFLLSLFKLFRVFFSILCVLAVFYLYMEEEVSWRIIALVNVIILASYYLFRPNNIFHPNNMVFAFFVLYVVLPTTLQFLFDLYAWSYVLPWDPPNWLTFNIKVFQHILLSFLLIFYGFVYFCRYSHSPLSVSVSISYTKLMVLLISVIVLYAVFISLSGGSEWIYNYRKAYLQGRKGLGIINFFIGFLTPLLCFVLGLYTQNIKNYLKKNGFILFSLLIMLFFAYFQGLKSKFPIYVIIYFYPYLQFIKIKNKNLIIFCSLFFIFLFFSNYLRSDGFYSSFAMQLEYIMTYFNVFSLHNMFLNDFESGFFNTTYFPLIKYLQYFGGYNTDIDFDLSIMLTKYYFPNQWYLSSATQQWPLVSDLYYNFYGFTLGWLPLLAYVFFLSKLYKYFCFGRLTFTLIYLLEFFRLFSTLRSTLIPWNFLVIIFFYVFIFFYLNATVRSNNLSKYPQTSNN